MTDPSYTEHIIKTVTDRASGFLQEEIELSIEKQESQVLDGHQFNVKQLTSFLNMNIGNEINLTIAFSFEDRLIAQILKVYTDDVEIEEDEYQETIEETAADVINIVLGNATTDLQEKGKLINISVPIVTHEAKNFSRSKNLKIYGAYLHTEYGKMRITGVSFQE